MSGSGPCNFPALANLPEPRKPEAFGMDRLHSVLTAQPQDIELVEEVDNLDPLRLAEIHSGCDKQKSLASRSTTCTQGMLDQMTDVDVEDDGTQSFNSSFSVGEGASVDHDLPPNRLMHDQNDARMKSFMKAAGEWEKIGSDLFRLIVCSVWATWNVQ